MQLDINLNRKPAHPTTPIRGDDTANRLERNPT